MLMMNDNGMVEQTILSLNTLFPSEDKATHKLLKKHGYSFHLEEPFDRPRTIDLLEAGHWRLRLLELYDVRYATRDSTLNSIQHVSSFYTRCPLYGHRY